MTDGPHGGGEDVADEQGDDDFRGGEPAHMQGGTRGGQGGADFGGEAQEHDAERLGPDEPEPRGMVGKPRLGGAEQTVVLHQVHGDVHGDGEHDELGQAAAEPFPCLERGALEGDFFLRQLALDTVLAMKGRQEEMPEAHREQGPQRGRREGQPRIDKGGSAEHGPEHEQHGRQMDHVGGQAVEQIGEHELAQADFALGVAVGQQGVGGGWGEEGHGKGRPGGFAQPGEPHQRRGKAGERLCPAQRFNDIGDEQANAHGEQKPGERAAQRQPERHQIGRYHEGRIPCFPGRGQCVFFRLPALCEGGNSCRLRLARRAPP